MRRSDHGVTLIEVMIAMAILVIAIVLSQSGIKLINDLTRQKVRMEAHTEAERALYMIQRDVLNAKAIISSDTVNGNFCIDPQKLELKMYDYSSGAGVTTYDTAVSTFLFQTTNIGTITYQVVQELSGVSLKRTVDLPLKGISVHHYLTNLLLSATTTFFTAASNVEGGGGGVEVQFPLKPAFWKAGEDRAFKIRLRKIEK